mmetsp:Transcript_40855/g.128285  ORF Transcript_40855/g.128285 Transcript_40855/m.128285 type:complete len:279 (+) Transcript_40855:2485-3321(+)
MQRLEPHVAVAVPLAGAVSKGRARRGHDGRRLVRRAARARVCAGDGASSLKIVKADLAHRTADVQVEGRRGDHLLPREGCARRGQHLLHDARLLQRSARALRDEQRERGQVVDAVRRELGRPLRKDDEHARAGEQLHVDREEEDRPPVGEAADEGELADGVDWQRVGPIALGKRGGVGAGVEEADGEQAREAGLVLPVEGCPLARPQQRRSVAALAVVHVANRPVEPVEQRRAMLHHEHLGAARLARCRRDAQRELVRARRAAIARRRPASPARGQLE